MILVCIVSYAVVVTRSSVVMVRCSNERPIFLGWW